MKSRPPLDLTDHLRMLHKQLLPAFFLLLSLVLIVFVAYRAGKAGAELPEKGYVGARVELVRPVAGAPYDPSLATLSPIEMVLAPEASAFEASPLLSGQVVAVADGRVVFAGGDAVVLVHGREGAVVESVYAGLTSVRVWVGRFVRRGEPLGGTGPDFRFATRPSPGIGPSPGAGDRGAVPEDWRGSGAGRLSPAPTVKPSEAGPLKVEENAAPAQ